MPEMISGVSELDARLAEIDQRLRAIQADLVPGSEPRPVAPVRRRETLTAVQFESGQERRAQPRPAVEQRRSFEQERRSTDPHGGRSGPLASLLLRAARTGPEHESEPQPQPQSQPAPQPQPQARSEPVAAAPSAAAPSAAAPDPVPPPPAAPPVEPPAVQPLDQLRALTEVHSHLLASLRELLSSYERVYAQLPHAESTPAFREYTVSAGPFTSTEALRAFERRLSGIPGVHDVSVSGYEGEDRAIVNVQLSDPRS